MDITKGSLENLISNCRTDKQVLKVLDQNNISYSNDSEECIPFNLHLSNGMRIYKNTRKEYIVQNPFKKMELKASGIPTFFSTNSYF